VPQFKLDHKAWADFVLRDTAFSDRSNRYRTGADMLLGEIVRFGALGGPVEAIGMLDHLYGRLLSGDTPMRVELRREIYQHVVGFQEHASLNPVASLPFIFCDPDTWICCNATIEYVSTARLIDGDPMTRVKEVIRMIAGGQLANPGAAFGGLLFLGDARVCQLLLPLRDGLMDYEARAAVGCCTGYLHASTIEFLLDWLEGMNGNASDGLFGIVAGGLGYARKLMQEPFVATGERPFPGTSVTPEEGRRMARKVSIDEYTAGIAPRLRALERSEPDPKVMPQILKIWGVSPES
jgi:hypothetical protein